MSAGLKQLPWLAGWLAFALVGLFLAYGGLDQSGLLGGWSRAEGAVKSHFPIKKGVFEAKVGQTFNGGIVYQYQVSGNTYRRGQHLFQVTRSEIDDFYASHPKGAAVTVLYQKDQPREARLAGDNPGKLPPWAKIGLGALFFLMGLGLAVSTASKMFKGEA